MRTYVLIGSNRPSVEQNAAFFAAQNGGTLMPTETLSQFRCESLDNDGAADGGAGGTVYLCRVNY